MVDPSNEQPDKPPKPPFPKNEKKIIGNKRPRLGGRQACIDEMQRIVESTRQRQQQRQEQSAAAAAADAAHDESPPTAAAEPSPSAEVYDEMLRDCRRKAGEATLDRLRKLCQRLSRPGGDGENGGGTGGSEGEGLMMSEEETVVVSYHAALLGKAEGAANIYGG